MRIPNFLDVTITVSILAANLAKSELVRDFPGDWGLSNRPLRVQDDELTSSLHEVVPRKGLINPANDQIVGDLADDSDALDVDDGELTFSVQEVVPQKSLSPYLDEEERDNPVNPSYARVKRQGNSHIDFIQYSTQFCNIVILILTYYIIKLHDYF